MFFRPISEALEAFARGEFLVVLGREDRENEGDLIISSSTIHQVQIAFLSSILRGTFAPFTVINEVDQSNFPDLTMYPLIRHLDDL